VAAGAGGAYERIGVGYGRHRPPGSAPAVRAIAEALPFPDSSFDAALAVLTVHHWTHPPTGLAELQRVAARQVVLTWDPEVAAAYRRRPRASVDPDVRAAMSASALLDPGLVARAVRRLELDLASGAWDRRYAALLERESMDLGYRIVVAG
jgi:SAM-dependent methyltransferase